ncbi:LytTR family DNA-binding domain-containing protein [Siphonobacter sp. SORGH_AS_1065]|uniref:LytR/AlgR family response regulator transcription factor n=1 Tax=Siphonobacter sp. SORGH_AS_1065 TaxID=3041795 RepID=UPI00278ABDA9|nr:LytTR family DNA-binding domain-containing protein [Siphonobacter sp. SORGH_AS_1065]MDQ1090134.1 DNA-binding LytR/AlgR family response regulator [Siphonobacter sp. SORGH_AS_1065]
MKVVIIEDEYFSAEKLRFLLEKLDPTIEVLAVLPSVEKSVAWFSAHAEPDLIFSDIQLEDQESFELFERLSIDAPIIYTTAYDQYAIQAFKQNSIDYLLKPIQPEELRAALKKYENQAYRLLKKGLLPTPQPTKSEPKERFMVRKGNGFAVVKVQDIAYFKSEDKLSFVVTFDQQKLLIDATLEELSEQLDPRRFNRISRNRLVCIDSIHKIHPHFNGRLKLELMPPDEEEVFVSRDRATAFKEWINS